MVWGYMFVTASTGGCRLVATGYLPPTEVCCKDLSGMGLGQGDTFYSYINLILIYSLLLPLPRMS